MAPHAVVTISDLNYLLPSAATMISARKNLSRSNVDVIQYVVVKENSELISTVAERLAPLGVRVASVSINEIAELRSTHADKAVPVSALSRLWLHRFLDRDIKTFLYLDGDILVDGAIDSIFDLDISPGGFLAADDCLCLYEHEVRQPHKYWQDYLKIIGVPWRDYFNTGVLLIDRQGWEELSIKAVRFLIENASICRSSDQTALNVVGRELRGRLPLRYNYQTEHMMVLDPRTFGIRPSIWHFAGGPKPWDAPEWPWNNEFNRGYIEAEVLLKGLDVSSPPINKLMFDEGRRHRQRQQNLQRWRFLFRRYNRARTIKKSL
jgi:lipopolysaccharide biosynthesis glycosyltransferase